MTDVAGLTTLVTGAASGIGRLLSLELASAGSRLALWDLDEERLHLVAKEIDEIGVDVFTGVCDVGDPDAVRAAADRVRSQFGDVDVLVNNAGIVSGRPFLELTDDDVERTFRVNTLSLYWTTRAFLPRMIERGRGHIVTVASAAGLAGVARQVDYSASKHAAVGFDESLRVELARSAPMIRTTVVCPYYIDTGMFAGVRTRVPSLLPILQPDDVARRIAGAIRRDQPRVLMPPIVHLVPLLHALPARWCDRLLDAFGINVSMDHFVGKGGR